MTYVVVNVFCRNLTTCKNVVIIAMVNDENAPRLDKCSEVAQCFALVLQVPFKVWQVRERISQTQHCIELAVAAETLYVIHQCHPVAFLDH